MVVPILLERRYNFVNQNLKELLFLYRQLSTDQSLVKWAIPLYKVIPWIELACYFIGAICSKVVTIEKFENRHQCDQHFWISGYESG